MKKIINYHSHLELNDYELGDCEELERRLSTYDKIYYRWIPKGFVYDNEKRTLLIPSGVSSNWISRLTGRELEVVYETDPYEKMSVRLRTEPRSQLQKEAIAFLIGAGKFKNYSKYSQLLLNLDTGEGKTYTTIALLSFKGLKSIIILNSEKIKKQWSEKLKEYTDIDERSICEFNGSAKCLSIINNPKKYSKYKVFITTHDTIRSFGNSNGWENVHELFKSLQVGVKIYDEAHLEFLNIVKIDCYTNTKFTYYLTATFGRSDFSENFVYQNCFKAIPKYEQRERTEYEGKKYINYLVYFYKSNPTIIQLSSIKNKYGFNRIAYSKYQLVDDELFFKNIGTLVSVTMKKSLKTLILMTTINGIEDLADYLVSLFPDKSIGIYHSKVKDIKYKEEALNGDIIISTVKSLGVGADIPGLKAVINTESFKSAIITEQVLGRLRKPSDDSICFYIEIVDKAFSTLRTQQKAREKVLKNLVGNILYLK